MVMRHAAPGDVIDTLALGGNCAQTSRILWLNGTVAHCKKHRELIGFAHKLSHYRKYRGRIPRQIEACEIGSRFESERKQLIPRSECRPQKKRSNSGTSTCSKSDTTCATSRLLTLDDTVEFFNLILELMLHADEKADLIAFLRVL